MNIEDDLKLKNDKPASLLLRSTDKVQIIAMGLKKGQVLKKHVSNTPTTLIVLKGVISFDMAGSTSQFSKHDVLEIPPGVPHEVTGLEECMWLLIKDKA